MKKLYTSIISSKWLVEDAYTSSYSSGSAPGHKLQKPLKEYGIFQSLSTISFVLFCKKAESKGGGMAQCPPPLNTLLS